ncbi:MAG: DUF389 domain-containing protein [Verrucomicrobiota bacterium]
MVVVVIQSVDEAAGLLRWGLRFAKSVKAEKVTALCIDHGRGVSSLEKAIEETEFDQQLLEVAAPDPESPRVVLKHLDELKPNLVVVGKQQSSRGEEGRPAKLARALFERAPFRTLLIRLGGSEGDLCRKILVPIRGGPHAREALRLGIRADEDSEICALRVQADAGQDAEVVGENILSDMVRGVGLTEPELQRVDLRIELNNNVAKGVRSVVESDNFDLLLVGASNSARLRRILFGAIPDRLLKADGGMAVGVVRSAPPMGQRLRAAIERFLHLRVPQLDRESRIAVVGRLQVSSRWSFDFMALIALSTMIAALGLIQNSAAVVIGAMLVAPLMTPLLGAGLALVQGNRALIGDCIRSIVYGFLGALLVGLIAGFGARGLGLLDGLTSELASRGGPNILDMGVALASGIAAAYCIARPNLTAALAGVAIAAALVPPIATAGISLGIGEFQNALGAILLFATNVVLIVLGAGFSFFAAGIRAGDNRVKDWARRTGIGLTIAAAVLAIPLGRVLLNEVNPEFELREQIEEVIGEDLQGLSIIVADDGSTRLSLDIIDPLAVNEETRKQLKELIEDRFDEFELH